MREFETDMTNKFLNEECTTFLSGFYSIFPILWDRTTTSDILLVDKSIAILRNAISLTILRDKQCEVVS